MKAIVKVQLPLMTNHPDMPALVYAEGKVNMVQQQLTDAAKMQMGRDFRAYFEAYFRNGTWVIGKRVVDRKW